MVSQRIIDPHEDLLYFSWWGYLGVVLVYSALTFHGEFSKVDGPLIFSKENSRSISDISLIHGVFLLAFLGAGCAGSLTRWRGRSAPTMIAATS